MAHFSRKSKWGLSKRGLKVLVHDCLRLSPFCDESRGPKRPQKCTIVDDCARTAESGLKPPFESPHLDFPEFCLVFIGFPTSIAEIPLLWCSPRGKRSEKGEGVSHPIRHVEIVKTPQHTIGGVSLR